MSDDPRKRRSVDQLAKRIMDHQNDVRTRQGKARTVTFEQARKRALESAKRTDIKHNKG